MQRDYDSHVGAMRLEMAAVSDGLERSQAGELKKVKDSSEGVVVLAFEMTREIHRKMTMSYVTVCPQLFAPN